MVTKKGERCLLRNVRSSIMVLLISDLKCPFEGWPDSDRKASKLHGTTTVTLFANLALISAIWMLIAAPTAKG